MAAEIGKITSLWRYPVKSMRGEGLQAAELTEYGLLGDRAYALIDGADGKTSVVGHGSGCAERRGRGGRVRCRGNHFDFRRVGRINIIELQVQGPVVGGIQYPEPVGLGLHIKIGIGSAVHQGRVHEGFRHHGCIVR